MSYNTLQNKDVLLEVHCFRNSDRTGTWKLDLTAPSNSMDRPFELAQSISFSAPHWSKEFCSRRITNSEKKCKQT